MKTENISFEDIKFKLVNTLKNSYARLNNNEITLQDERDLYYNLEDISSESPEFLKNLFKEIMFCIKLGNKTETKLETFDFVIHSLSINPFIYSDFEKKWSEYYKKVTADGSNYF